MQISKPMDQKRRIITWAAIAGLALLIVLAALGVFRGGSRAVGAMRLRCVATQDVTPFGDSVLYYDGMTLFCLNARGGEKWSYTLGSGAAFSCNENTVVAWTGTQLHIINKNGYSTYNENLADVIQFARPGSKYVAVVLGSDVSPSLVIKDMQGTTVDNETAAYEDMLILDLGFFDNGEYLWTTSLDVYGTVPNTIMHTFRVNMSNSGEISLGESLAYAVIYAGGQLNVVSTRQLRRFDYRGTQDTSGTVLVYGWHLQDHQVNGSTAMMLFSLASSGAQDGISQLRLLSGKTDKRFTLPSACAGAALYNRRVYAFSHDTIYRADINAQRFSAISMPAELGGAAVTGYLGMLKNGVALLACDSDVYAVTLP